MFKTFPATVTCLFTAQGLFGLGMGIFMVLLNLYLRSIGYSEEVIGRLLAFQSLCAAVISMPMGWLADKTSRKTTYLLGIVLLSTGFAMLGSGRGLVFLTAAVLLAGSGNGAMMVSVQPYLQENSRRRQRPYIFSFNFTLMWVTSVISGIVAGYLPGLFRVAVPALASAESEPERLQYSLWVGIIFTVLALVPARNMSTQRAETGHEKANGRSDASSVANPWREVLKFTFCNGLIGFGAGMIVPYFNLYFNDWVGASILQIGVIFAVGQFGTAVGSICSPLIAKKAGLVKGVAFSQLASLPFMAIMALSHDLWICAMCFSFRSAFMNMCIPLRQETMMEMVPSSLRARVSAIDSMSWNLTWALAMTFSGGILKNWGYDTSLFIAIVCYLISAISYYFFFSPWEKSRKAHR
ncbi:MAG: MFS transporter [Candidatus Rifleibacteriota bacterium]